MRCIAIASAGGPEVLTPLTKAAAAHRLMESSDHVGKIVLTTPGFQSA